MGEDVCQDVDDEVDDWVICRRDWIVEEEVSFHCR